MNGSKRLKLFFKGSIIKIVLSFFVWLSVQPLIMTDGDDDDDDHCHMNMCVQKFE